MNASTTTDTMGTIVEPSLVNKGFFRAAVIIGTVAGAFLGGKFLPGVPAMSLHLAAAGIWLGVNVWTTFFAGITMFKNLPRQVFGKLQAKLFPLCALVTAFVPHQLSSDAVLSCVHHALPDCWKCFIVMSACSKFIACARPVPAGSDGWCYSSDMSTVPLVVHV